MKYKSTLFDEARNKIGGIVASANKDGNYFRAKVTPKNPRSADQAAVRSTFAANSAAWRTLTDIQRAGWVALAAQMTLSDSLGNKYKPSGQQLYVGCNANLASIGMPAISTAPGSPDTPAELSNLQTSATVETATPHTQAYQIGASANVSSFVVIAKSTPLYSAGRAYVGPSQLRLLKFDSGTTFIVVNLLAEFQAKFGNLVVGSKVTTELKVITPNGFASLPYRTDTIVTAA